MRFPSTIGRIVERSARRTPDAPALTFEDRSYTYAELDLAVGRVARGLRELGLAKGDRVAAFGKNSDAYLLLFLGCARAGLVHVPVNFNARRGELEYLLTQSGPKAAFADAALGELVAREHHDLRATVLGWAAEGDVHEEDGVEDGDLVQLLYTSGTTSKPKGAMLTHRALVHEYVSCITSLQMTAADVPLHPMPLYHSAQMHVFLLPYLAVGAVNHLVEAPVVDDILERVPRLGVDALFLPPTVWVGVAAHDGLDALSGLKKAFYGASIMPGPVLAKLQERLPEVGFYNCFGQSEIGPLATVLRPEEHAQRPDSVGRAVLFVETRVVDEDFNDVEEGEVVYRSPQLCEGYWNMPEATAEAFAGGWFHSGDLVRIDAEGYMVVVDRIKDVINTGGVLVASREVEDALYAHDAVAEVAVVGLPHERWIEAIAAVVVRDGDVSEADLIAFAKETLSGPKVPKSVHFVDELPKNASGKVLKRELRDSLAP